MVKPASRALDRELRQFSYGMEIFIGDITLDFDDNGRIPRVLMHKTKRQRQNSTTGQPAGDTPGIR